MWLVVRRTFLRNYDTGDEILLEKTAYGDGFADISDALECLDKAAGAVISRIVGSSFEFHVGGGRFQVEIDFTDDSPESDRSVTILSYDVAPGCVYGTEFALYSAE